MRIGVVAPTFNSDARRAVEFAKKAESAGIDLVCVFDHLYPLGQPDRSALAWLPVLSAIGETTSLTVMPLIARIGIRPNRLLIQECATLQSLFGNRFIAAFGIGDAKAEEEYLAYGVPYKSFGDRLADAVEVCSATQKLGITTWISARSPEIHAELAPHLDGINAWEADPTEMRSLIDAFAEKTISWAGVWNEKTGEVLGDLSTMGCEVAIVYFARDAEANLAKLAARLER